MESMEAENDVAAEVATVDDAVGELRERGDALRRGGLNGDSNPAVVTITAVGRGTMTSHPLWWTLIWSIQTK
jgi:hypothetical protein